MGASPVSRRQFLVGAGSAAGVLLRPDLLAAQAAAGTTLATTARPWLGPDFWANRLQDWQLASGRLECIGGSVTGARTVGWLTRSLLAGDAAATLTVATGCLQAGPGFSGFLVGTGAGRLDYRAAALVGAASGTGGGLFCVYDSDGAVRFREHTSETDQFAYAEQAATAVSGPRPARTTAEDVTLTLEILPVRAGVFDLRLTARQAGSGAGLSTATLPNVTGDRLVGGISLVSSSPVVNGARHWLRTPSASGPKVAVSPTRALGPILGALFSVSNRTLKLTAQLMPIGTGDPQFVALQVRRPLATTWTTAQTAAVGAGYCATFRLAGWDSTVDWDFRLLYGGGTTSAYVYTGGRIPADPVARDVVTLGLTNCSIHSFRPLDAKSSGAPRLAGEASLGLYTAANLYFPYAETTRLLDRQAPDLLVASGDQYYEHRPTRKDPGSEPTLDFLYRYYLWLWAFRDLTKKRPTVVLMDDHDVFQGNIWGHAGAPAPQGDQNQGGYVKSPSWVNAVQRCQTSHNPDAFDPRTVQQGIGVYYGAFRYGGVSFALLEDRKFKTGDADGKDALGNVFVPADLQLLGSRQESFLTQWAAADAGLPKVCLTQTMFGCLQTDSAGTPVRDYDSNGYPAANRRTAVQLLKDAKALILGGDQHLGSVVRHGINTFDDGPVEFVAPAMGTAYARWFEPGPLPAPGAQPHTGDFVDGFGNRMRVLAVANPTVSFATYRAGYPGATQNLGDRRLKRDGYGIVKVDKAAARFLLECWPWDADPSTGGRPYPGWPVSVPFGQV